MSDTISFRLDGEIAATARTHAERSGLPLTAYIHELLRSRLRESPGLQPVHIARGNTQGAGDEFERDRVTQNVTRVWVFRDLIQPIVWALPATLEACDQFRVRIRPTGGVAFAVPRDNLVAWPPYGAEHESVGLMFEWIYAGATLHPWDTTGFKRQQRF